MTRDESSPAMGFAGVIFDVDGVLVDSPHEVAWRESLAELMTGPWQEAAERSTWSPDSFTSRVYREVLSGSLGTREHWPASSTSGYPTRSSVRASTRSVSRRCCSG